MPKSSTNILHTNAILAVEDVDTSRDFYVNKLGCEEVLRVGGWSFVQREEMRFRIGHCPGISPMGEAKAHALMMQIECQDARALYEEFKANGVEIGPIEDKPWGFREFGVVTPDGHRMMFTQSLGDYPSDPLS